MLTRKHGKEEKGNKPSSICKKLLLSEVVLIARSGHSEWYWVFVVAQSVKLSLLLYVRGSQEIVPEKP